MLNLDPSKLLIIAVVAIILLGPDRLPALPPPGGRSLALVHRLSASQGGRDPQLDARSPEHGGDRPPGSFAARTARSPFSHVVRHGRDEGDRRGNTARNPGRRHR